MRFRTPRRLRRATALATIALIALLSITPVAAQSGQPTGITEEAGDIHNLYLFVLVLATVILVAVEAALVFAIFRYRKRDEALPPQIHGSTFIEVIWTVIPIVIVALLFVTSWVVLRDIEYGADEADLTVEVNGFQWNWAFVYNLDDLGRGQPQGEGKLTIQSQEAGEMPELVIPVGEPVEFKLSSNDVIHSFYVREILYKLDVVPGRDNRFVVVPTKTGEFVGQCAEFCGLDHAIMRFRLRVVERAEFDRWVAEQAAASQAAARQR